MEKNIFQLDNEQLKEIARSFKAKVEEGLNTENAEIQCIPTFITPKASSINGKSCLIWEEPIIGWQSLTSVKFLQLFTPTMVGRKTCRL